MILTLLTLVFVFKLLELLLLLLVFLLPPPLVHVKLQTNPQKKTTPSIIANVNGYLSHVELPGCAGAVVAGRTKCGVEERTESGARAGVVG